MNDIHLFRLTKLQKALIKMGKKKIQNENPHETKMTADPNDSYLKMLVKMLGLLKKT